MSFIIPLLLLIVIPSIVSFQPTLKLTFTPNETYFTADHHVEILCEILNPTDRTESPQLWHVDLKTGRSTSISRSLIFHPPDDAPDVFKQKRVDFVRKNHIRIRRLVLEDTARYECNCPNCEEPLGKKSADLHVMRLVEPKWHFEPGWPLQENAKTTIRCTVDDFYPYVTHQIFRNHHDATKEGKSHLPHNNTFPQRFAWEATVSPSADWHNVSLDCAVTEGKKEMRTSKHLDVLFSPRFHHCEERQHVNSTKETGTIECAFAGNPPPKLLWFRRSDGKQLDTDVGITIETKDERHGRYKSIITFDRDKLTAIPLTTTTRAPNAAPETSTPARILGDTYYQQLLNGGFVAKLISNRNEERDSRNIQIVSDVQQTRTNAQSNPSSSSRSVPLTSILFGFSSLLLFSLASP